jgi:adenine deaminase
MASFSITGNLVDVQLQKIYPATVTVENGKIISIDPTDDSRLTTPSYAEASEGKPNYILPGFIDSHVHIESSMLVPSEFARLAVVHGTVSTVSDPHEIANVCGMEGVEFMIENGKTVPFKFNFGAPSCVPATVFETAGAALDSVEVDKLLQRDEIKYLSEMMNYPGVLNGDEEVMKKIAAAHRLGKPVDGHAPGLRGEDARNYIKASPELRSLPSLRSGSSKGGALDSGNTKRTPVFSDSENPPLEGREAVISTDHECFTAEEALDKLKYGMKIIIREGSAAKNFEALIGLLHDWPDHMMFCSDDKHPDSLVLGHINQLCARAVAKGIDVFKILKAACVNPVLHYKLDVGLLRAGDPADFIVVKDLANFEVIKTFINGELVAENGISHIKTSRSAIINNFSCDKTEISDFSTPFTIDHSPFTIPVIEALDGQLITNKLLLTPQVRFGKVEPDEENDVLKIAVVNRYNTSRPAVAFIKNFGLRSSAIASSVAHDSHNIVVVGTADAFICNAVNLVIEHKGGVSFSSDGGEMIVPLPVAGLMSNEDGYAIAGQYSRIDNAAKEAGSTLGSPFMTLSFMALLVIPHLKLSDKGLFDGDAFRFL